MIERLLELVLLHFFIQVINVKCAIWLGIHDYGGGLYENKILNEMLNQHVPRTLPGTVDSAIGILQKVSA